ncbi:MAG: MarR family transcriptional regulator [Lentisphaeria bacterium]|nr:MarR family transcriptional regulator [Lentisphaeria bacterium]MBR3688286.1 MarR family transcriptional regulator [Lentisphaeria bacterium]
MISSNEARSYWVRLFDVSDILRNTSYYLLEKNKVQFNFAEFPIVQFFFERPDARPAVKDLLAVTGLSSGAVSQAVDALIRDGLLERVQSEQDHRSFLIQVTEQLREFRKTPLRHFEKMLEAFRQYSGTTPEEMAVSEELYVRLAESRTGGELAVIRQPSDLSVPGLVSHEWNGLEYLNTLPVWSLILHFTTNLKIPVMVYYYGKRGRMTLGKLRLLNYLFHLSGHNIGSPSVKDLAARFRVPSGVVSQTLNAMIQDGMVERVPSPHDRRMNGIRLTQQGLRMRRQCASSYTCFMQNFFSLIEPEKINVFDRDLDLTLQFLKSEEGRAFLMPGETYDPYL